jgi:L-iditol 2-dehydrogenase
VKALRKLGDDAVLSLVDIDTPEPGPGIVRLAVHACGLCGTDLHITDGSYSSRPPVTLGHEVAGVVDRVGAGVDPDFLGAEVATETFFSTCGACDRCREGRTNLCAQRVSIGSGTDGGFAASLLVPARNIHRLPPGIGATAGALMEPLACVCQSLLEPAPKIQPGDRVAVFGPGTIGLLAAQVARRFGGRPVVVGLPDDAARLAVAESLGIGTVIGGETDLGIADVAVDCSGAGPAMAAGLRAVRHGGRYIQMGQTDKDVRVPLALTSFKELTITGGFATTPPAWRRAIGLLEAGGIELAALVSAVWPLTRWREAFTATARSEGLKYLLDPREGSS